MAGGEAERILLGIKPEGDELDRQQIASMIEAELPDANETRLRRTTAILVRQHRGAIAAVAKALLRRRTLSGRQIDAIVHRVERQRGV